jgi:hypothetical protein
MSPNHFPSVHDTNTVVALTRDERRKQIAAFLARRFGQAIMDDEECTGAMLEVLLDCLGPNPSDRPTAKDLLSYHLFSLIEDETDKPNDGVQSEFGRQEKATCC